MKTDLNDCMAMVKCNQEGITVRKGMCSIICAVLIPLKFYFQISDSQSSNDTHNYIIHASVFLSTLHIKSPTLLL